MPTKKTTKQTKKTTTTPPITKLSTAEKSSTVRITYRVPYATSTTSTNNYNEAAYLVARRQASLLEVAHSKKGKRVLVFMTYLNNIGGIETAMLNLAKTYQDENLCFVINGHAENAEPLIMELARYHDVVLDKENAREYTGDIALIMTPIMANVPFERIHAGKTYQFIHSEVTGLKSLERWKNLEWTPDEHIDEIVTVSKTAQKGLKQEFGLDSVVVANILDEPSKRPVFLSLTRSTKEKGIDRIAKMVEALDRAGKDYIWYICTALDPYGDDARELTKSPHVAIIEPNIYNDSLLRAATYLAQLSTTESYCYSAHQAIKAGVPVIGTRIPEFEKLIKDGENGYLVSLDLSDLDIEKIFNDIPKFQAEPEDIDPNWQKLLNGEL